MMEVWLERLWIVSNACVSAAQQRGGQRIAMEVEIPFQIDTAPHTFPISRR